MQDSTVTLVTPASAAPGAGESASSAISWPSIIGGALAITAVSMIFLTFGGALGLMPHGGRAAMTSLAAIWLIAAQWIASAVGGYLTGRLRTKWVSVHTHEVFFRDTAHGFLAWATAMLFGAVILALTLSAAAAHWRAPMQGARAGGGPIAYYVDSLYRGNGSAVPTTTAPAPVPAPAAETAPTPEGAPAAEAAPTPGPAPTAAASPPRIDPEVRAETTRLLEMDMRRKTVPDEDKTYLAQSVAAHTGLSQTEAAQRVDTVLAQAQADAAMAHKAIGYVSLFAGLAMLIGAFIAAAASAFGGSQRDEWEEAVRAGTYAG